MKFARKTRAAWNKSIPGALVSDVVDGVKVVGHKIDTITDPVTEPVARKVKPISTKVSDRLEERRILRQMAKDQVEEQKASATS